MLASIARVVALYHASSSALTHVRLLMSGWMEGPLSSCTAASGVMPPLYGWSSGRLVCSRYCHAR